MNEPGKREFVFEILALHTNLGQQVVNHLEQVVVVFYSLMNKKCFAIASYAWTDSF